MRVDEADRLLVEGLLLEPFELPPQAEGAKPVAEERRSARDCERGQDGPGDGGLEE